eukprot:5497602-Pleurochrysis_carterae.AAC.3
MSRCISSWPSFSPAIWRAPARHATALQVCQRLPSARHEQPSARALEKAPRNNVVVARPITATVRA